MFHVAMWRERMRDALRATVGGARSSLDEALSELADLGADDYVTGILTELRADPRLKSEAG